MKANKFFALAMAALAIAACGPKNAPDEAKISIEAEVTTVKVGETITLKAVVEPEGTAVKWSSSNTSLATVDANGVVTGIAPGKPYIIAEANGKQAMTQITVYEEGQTVVELSSRGERLDVGAELQLTATVTPAEKASLLQWSSSDVNSVSVDQNGLCKVLAYTPVAVIIKATVDTIEATCQITINKPKDGGDEINHPSLKGSDYFIFQIGAQSGEQIADRVVADFREDNITKHLYVWEDGKCYNALDASGKNFYGEADGWVSLQVASVGWSGMAYNCEDLALINKLSMIMEAPDEFYLHLAMRSTDYFAHNLFLDGTTGKGVLHIGNWEGQGQDVNFTRNGDWGEIEVPMSHFINQGLVYGNNNPKGLNVLGFNSGGVTGTMLQFDAMFIYRKPKAE